MEKKTIYVSNVSVPVDEKALKYFFSPFGHVSHVEFYPRKQSAAVIFKHTYSVDYIISFCYKNTLRWNEKILEINRWMDKKIREMRTEITQLEVLIKKMMIKHKTETDEKDFLIEKERKKAEEKDDMINILKTRLNNNRKRKLAEDAYHPYSKTKRQ